MAIPWMVIAEGVAKAYQAYQEREQAKNDKDKAEQSIRKVIDAIDQAKREIINEIVNEIKNTRLRNLDGDVNGIVTIFNDYHIYSKDSYEWESEGERLRDLIDTSALIIGHFVAEFRSLNYNDERDFKFGVNIYPLYTNIVSVRSVAMIERTYTYGIDDKSRIPPMIEELKKHTRKMYDALRKRSDDRFGPLGAIFKVPPQPSGPIRIDEEILEPGEREVDAYHWIFRPSHGGIGSSRTCSVKDVFACEEERKLDMDREFLKYPGVQPVLKAKAALNI